ncbi:AAA family ATPase [Leptospira perolatii]|uniref:AAA family ATPase n=2 Tax=Leptospira perolatii TaxID=2023191 RepID=A0A2M9ZIK3_9LEPT|nr:AAA family ATPase [Leptospira perolatii]PJZ71886.1 AAA family ATPase [Leptospira perolatii]
MEGLEVFPVGVEINLKPGIPRFTVTGMAAQAIRESGDRIRVSIENSGFVYPLQSILVHLAPAGRKKEGTYLDLSIAVGILLLTKQLQSVTPVHKTLFLGELGLDGSVRPLKGILPILMKYPENVIEQVILPFENQQEAALLDRFPIYPVAHLKELENALGRKMTRAKKTNFQIEKQKIPKKVELYQDQLVGLRMIQVAVAGWHHCLLVGPPGAGKSLLSKFAQFLLPNLRESECLELMYLRSLRETIKDLKVSRPFRSPHHTVSDVALVGGSRNLSMGEVSLASHGILFLDELSEFSDSAIQALREPLEEREITISRITGSVTYPAPFLLISASNPCTCGYYQSKIRVCSCTQNQIRSYQASLAGPFLDRIELFCYLRTEVHSGRKVLEVDLHQLQQSIERSVQFQEVRNSNKTGKLFNGNLRADEIVETIPLRKQEEEFLIKCARKFRFSIRKSNQMRKVSRTIADLEGSLEVELRHLEEALFFLNDNLFQETRASA